MRKETFHSDKYDGGSGHSNEQNVRLHEIVQSDYFRNWKKKPTPGARSSRFGITPAAAKGCVFVLWVFSGFVFQITTSSHTPGQ